MNHPYDPHADPLNDWIDARHNGTEPPVAPPTDPDLADLFATADQLDHLARLSDEHALLNRPPVTTWEHVMNTLPPFASGHASPPAPASARIPSREMVVRRPSAPAMRRATPMRWLMAIGLCLALLVGSFAVYVDRNRSNGPEPTVDQPLALAAQDLASTPEWAPVSPLSASECTFEPRSDEELAELQRNPVTGDAPVYFPTRAASADDALAIYEASRLWAACRWDGSESAMQSDRLISDGPLDSIARNSRSLDEYVINNRTLASLLLPSGREEFAVYSDQSVPVNAEVTPGPNDLYFFQVIQPEDVVVFPDGRMGGPLSQMRPANYDEIVAADLGPNYEYIPPLVQYAIFTQEDSRWVMDEVFNVCANDCDTWFRNEAEGYYLSSRSLVIPATPIILPITGATPEASAPGSSSRGNALVASR